MEIAWSPSHSLDKSHAALLHDLHWAVCHDWEINMIDCINAMRHRSLFSEQYPDKYKILCCIKTKENSKGWTEFTEILEKKLRGKLQPQSHLHFTKEGSCWNSQPLLTPQKLAVPFHMTDYKNLPHFSESLKI